ncbi:hypothetical protein K0M31_009594 [Melipona bicolor]|uniref:Chitin-binding type-2 domain-containing protein n=1 Tax=Melipona bicolor TaxID=60889 RepID=A0AA40KJA5_9HYME|nr:hypothetical protein K0M31_009594 [Melipona bicolor]
MKAAADKDTDDCPQVTSTNCVFNEKCLDVIGSNVTVHIPDPDDCHKFYKCAGGDACLLCCPLINPKGSKRLVFNPELQVCDWPQNVQNPVGKCDDVNPPSQPTTTTSTEPTTTSTKSTTTSTEPTTTSTEPTTTSTEPTTTSTEPTTTTKQEPADQDCPKSGIKLIADKADANCRNYYRCDNGIKKGPYPCLEGHIFNPTIGDCDVLHNYRCPPTSKPEYFD